MYSEFTRQIPQLTNLTKQPVQPVLYKKRKWNINKILLVGFLIFTIFFLYNCRYGMFRVKQENVVPYTVSVSQNNKNQNT